jgi:hypothetical protein
VITTLDKKSISLFLLLLVAAIARSSSDDKLTTEAARLQKPHPQIAAGEQCVSCHKDAHAGELGADCQQCHSVVGAWKRSWTLFDHAERAQFPLVGAHAALQCSACHKEKSYRSVKKQCAACHEDVQRFYRGTAHFDEITTTPSPMFSLVRCEDCHAKDASRTRLSQIESACARCHTPDYATLAAYWQGALFTETDALISETKSLEQKINQALSGRGSQPVPTDLRITLQNAQKDLRATEQLLGDLRRTALHNLPLLSLELSHTKRQLDKMTQLLRGN